MRMTGSTKHLRRFTARSRLRASLALSFLSTSLGASAIASTASIAPVSAEERNVLQRGDIADYLAYYYLLAEIQEIRLSTSEEIILNCLSFQMILSSQSSSGQANQSADTNRIVHRSSLASSTINGGLMALSSASSLKNDFNHLKSLISTWIHDEGKLQDTIELSCDLLYFYYFYHTQQHQLYHTSNNTANLSSFSSSISSLYQNDFFSTSSSFSPAVGCHGMVMIHDKSLFHKLISNMINFQQNRILFRFLTQCSLEYPTIFEYFLYDEELNPSIFQQLLVIFEYLVERFQYFYKLSIAKSSGPALKTNEETNTSSSSTSLMVQEATIFSPMVYDLANISHRLKELFSNENEDEEDDPHASLNDKVINPPPLPFPLDSYGSSPFFSH